MRLECLTCHGTYDAVTADGNQYFHVCPPLSVAELKKAVEEQRVTLPPGENLEDAHGRRVYERAEKRDERPVPRTVGARTSTIIAAGKGVLEIPALLRSDTSVIVPDRHDAV